MPARNAGQSYAFVSILLSAGAIRFVVGPRIGRVDMQENVNEKVRHEGERVDDENDAHVRNTVCREELDLLFLS